MGNNWWAGNWWRGAVAAVVPSSLPLEEQIRELVAVKLATITVANGYAQNVTVYRPPVDEFEIPASGCPAVLLRSAKRSLKGHLRRAEEFILECVVICVVANSSPAPAPDEALAKLLADVRKLVYANRKWNDGVSNLARRTWIPDDIVHETEVQEATISSRVTFNILARSSVSNLAAVKEV